MQSDVKTGLALLHRGEAPGNPELLRALTVGVDFITDFWKEKYFEEYIAAGGSKIKFVTGGPGSGKTHLLQVLGVDAAECGCVTAAFSAKDVWIHDFKEIYAQVFDKADLLGCLAACGEKLVADMGFAPGEIPQGMTFADYLSAEGLLDGLTKRELRQQLGKLFLHNPLIDNNFGLACSLLTGGLLGYPLLEDHNQEQLLLWLGGDKAASLPALRRLGLFPCRITKYNARHMLRSLVEVLKLAGYGGLVVTVDDLEMLASRDSLAAIRYTKAKREDAYESIRELIDEIDTLRNVMFVFAFDRKLLEDELLGLKSYQALWMRIQNEIVSQRFNRFADIVDLDELAKQRYTEEVLLEMSARLAQALNAWGDVARPISGETAEALIAHTQFTQDSLPRQVNAATRGGVVCD